MPVSGDNIPPNRNIRNPRSAEAVPELFRSIFSARVVELGSISPRKNKNTNSNDSNIQKFEQKDNIAATAVLAMPKQAHPQRKAAVALRNLVTARLPIIMAMALAPKQRPYTCGDVPKCTWKTNGEAAIYANITPMANAWTRT